MSIIAVEIFKLEIIQLPAELKIMLDKSDFK